ncbi:MAG: glycoside hydrolase family 9 protein [bacterium]
MKAYAVAAAILACTTVATPGQSEFEDGRRSAGLRSARLAGPGSIEIVFGAGFCSANLAKHPEWIQVVSPTDVDFQRGVPAAAVTFGASEPDGTYPNGWTGPRFIHTPATVTLPAGKAIRPNQTYFIRVNAPQALAENLAAQWITGTAAPVGDDRAPRYGLRQARIVTPTLIQLTVGPGLDLKRLADPTCIAVTSSDDPAFAKPVAPKHIGRRSTLDFYRPDAWPWHHFDNHLLFIELPTAMKPGKSYRVDLAAKTGAALVCGDTAASVLLDDRVSINPAVKVNQIGYLPDATKYAYIGLWLGDRGACDLSPYTATFEVRHARSHAVMLTGTPTLRRRATFRLVDGQRVPCVTSRPSSKVEGPETVYKQDLSYEDVWQIDLSALHAPGDYYLAIPGVGRSYAFRVAADVYTVPFATVMSGLLHQRCGLAFEPSWSPIWRAPCHRGQTEYSTATLETAKDIHGLAKFATDGKKHDLYGGHHDAGDWNPRSHLDVARVLLLAWELNPSAFYDGQLTLPEPGNGIPDILDEARWELDLWCRLQAPDGGVHEYIESEGDPREGDAAETDGLREFAYAPTASGSYAFAAVAAQAAMAWKAVGRTDDAAVFLARSRKAWNWAEMHGGTGAADLRAEAAAALFRATGAPLFDTAFRTSSVMVRSPSGELKEYGKYDQIYASFHYLRAAKADPAVQAMLANAFERTFTAWRRAAETTTYRHMRSPYAPSTWGTGGLPVWAELPAMTWAVSNDEAIRSAARDWLLFTDDFSLGCHPLNLVFTVGLGQRYITSAFHHLMRTTPSGLIPGLISNGPGGRFSAGEAPGRSMGNWPAQSLYPPGQWPALYMYAEDASPGMNEGIVANQVKVALAYSLFLPPHR